jgi:hypothetical protein
MAMKSIIKVKYAPSRREVADPTMVVYKHGPMILKGRTSIAFDTSKIENETLYL